MVQDGIKYALNMDQLQRTPTRQANNNNNAQHENVSFFEILQEFSPKLHRQDKLAV